LPRQTNVSVQVTNSNESVYAITAFKCKSKWSSMVNRFPKMLSVTLIIDLLTTKSDQFISVPNCI